MHRSQDLEPAHVLNQLRELAVIAVTADPRMTGAGYPPKALVFLAIHNHLCAIAGHGLAGPGSWG
ncbi:hypothetical protein [Gluconobacter sp. P1D12_c]|uniref:hypothetical protein n=1 Tax=Gluconobacter sp. P1D12_c TaxID=2762614 RepID=UPI001C0465DE|nr:hypothetical protein [Gluconobacter sp. P1D12_c]